MGAPSTTILETQLKDDLNNICNWISANNLTLNSKKSQLLIIAPNLKFSNVVLNIQSPAGEIKTVFKAKYLGILFDNRLNFLEVKIARSVGILNKLKYFLPNSALLKLYYALIHSHFNYRSFPLNVPTRLMYHGYINWKQVPVNVPWYINRRQSFVLFEYLLIGFCHKAIVTKQFWFLHD